MFRCLLHHLQGDTYDTCLTTICFWLCYYKMNNISFLTDNIVTIIITICTSPFFILKILKFLSIIWRCVHRVSYCKVLISNELHNSYNKYLFHSFCLLYIFWTNPVVHQQQHGIIYCITQFGTIGTIVQACPAAKKLQAGLVHLLSSWNLLHDCTDCTKLCNVVY